jgi:3-hydroxybutyryl-CoA dehydratase
MPDGKGYNEVSVGDAYEAVLRVTEAHLSEGAALTGDFNPLHVDDAFARASRYGGRILHGVMTGAIAGAPLGMWFHGTAIAYLEHNCRFLAPVRAGDTLTTRWTVVEKVDKPKHDGGIVVVRGETRNQAGAVVLEATGKMLVAVRT